LFIVTIVTGAAAAKGDTVAVLELRSRHQPMAAAEVTDRVREAIQRALPDARVVDREGDADLIVTGFVAHGGLGYRAGLELRDRQGNVLQRASATAASRRELAEAMEGAAGDLFRARQENDVAGALAIAPTKLAAVPAPQEVPDDALNLPAETRVLVAWDLARRAEVGGKDHPAEAAAAWRRVAGIGGPNPYREIALARAQQWEAFAESRRAADAQMTRDTSRLRNVLPLPSVTDTAKIELLVRYATAYGFDKVSPLVALLPTVELRERAELSLDCEVKETRACVQLARVADQANDAKAALEYLDRACGAGDAESCSEAGDRWLQKDTRDPPRAIAALQRGCDAANAAACVRLARVYEEGDGAAASPTTAADLREKACSAGDGKSCRRLAGMADAPARVIDLLKKGCDGGDSVSCALASKEPAIVRRQLQEAATGARTPARAVKPANAVDKPAEKVPAPSLPRTEATPSHDHPAIGGALIVLGAVAGAGAYLLTTSGDDYYGYSRSGRALVTRAPQINAGREILTVALGSAAVFSTGIGLALLFHKPETPETPKVGVAPNGVVLSGNFR
jgi:TPR repeat protein